MSTNAKAQVDALLVEVLRKPEDEREAFLDLVCRDDDKLRRELKGLLAASDEAADFLERPAVQVSETVLSPLREGPGMTIGRYKLRASAFLSLAVDTVAPEDYAIEWLRFVQQANVVTPELLLDLGPFVPLCRSPLRFVEPPVRWR